MTQQAELETRQETIHVDSLSAMTTRLNFSEGVAGLTDPNSPYGCAYLGSLGLLGIGHDVQSPSLTLTGNSARVVEAIPRLAGNIGLLAAAGSERAPEHQQDDYRLLLQQLLGRVTDELSTNVGPTMRFPHTVAAIAVLFAGYQLPTGDVHLSYSDDLAFRSRPLHRLGSSNVIKATH